MAGAGELDNRPGFRRRFCITPAADQVTAAVEDDYHCMAVTLRHDGAWILSADAVMERVPWTTCPGAVAVLAATFSGTALSGAAARGEKKANCTHLHDLAVLAAAHAGDAALTTYDIVVSDPVDGCVQAEIRRNGAVVHRLAHRDDVLISPPALAGVSLFALRDWIRSLDGVAQEAARLFQWGAILAHGRTYPMDRQSDASVMPQNCYTFQPEQKGRAVRVGRVFDFSRDKIAPLDHFDDGTFTPRTAHPVTEGAAPPSR